jgi:hypothetical protein
VRQSLPLSWICTCRVPPLVLARFNLRGDIALQHEDRYWLVGNRITTNCPGCGKQHRLELDLDPAVLANLPPAWDPNVAHEKTTGPVVDQSLNGDALSNSRAPRLLPLQ